MSKLYGKPRSRSSFRRPAPRLSGDLILIVCEGEATEPSYFKAIKQQWRIPPLQVEVYGKECGSDPCSVVRFAIAKKEIPRDEDGLYYDQAWCVIDKDKHTNLKMALVTAKANRVNICLSVPCFEFWYLLHFVYTTKPFTNAKAVISELKKHLKHGKYQKNTSPVKELMPRLNSAIRHAQKVRTNNEETGSDNPSTGVDLLIKELRKICGMP